MRAVTDISPSQILKRRLLFGVLGFVIFAPGCWLMADILAAGGFTVLEWGMLALFAVLFGQVVFGTGLALTGFCLHHRGGDSLRISATSNDTADIDTLPGTAIVMPIFNEDVGRVFQGLRVVFESLQRTGRLQNFDFFVLSDSNDPNRWVAEEKMWVHLCKQVDGFGHIFYRKRRVTLNHKSGNVADFCRRWGAHYRYMIVLDADSIMTGELLVKLVHLMEQNPTVGIIQTAPQQVFGQSLFSRIQQFAGRLYAPIFAAGANFWHLGEGTYWGHNAIIRLKPFMEYCALPELPVIGGFGGRILSHDSVEAAFMRRAGYEVWFAYDLDGSYEEGPPDLLASLKRDMRWCQGNMQHLLVLTRRGLKAGSRSHLLIGILGFASAPLWLLFIILSLILERYSDHPALVVKPAEPAVLFGYVMVLLLLPKFLGLINVFTGRSPKPAFARKTLVLLSAGLETIFSMLLAPILMLAHSRFVFTALTGMKTQWGRQNRGEQEPTWGEVGTAFLGQTFIGVAGFAAILWMLPGLLPWLSPVLAGWLLSIPFAGCTSSVALGKWFRELGFFVVPEEVNPPPELRLVEDHMEFPESRFFQQLPYLNHYGLLQAVLDPYINAIHVSLLRWREGTEEPNRSNLELLRKRLVIEGPAALTATERSALMWDPDSMVKLHEELWICVTEELSEWWRLALRNYNEALAATTRRRFVGT